MDSEGAPSKQTVYTTNTSKSLVSWMVRDLSHFMSSESAWLSKSLVSWIVRDHNLSVEAQAEMRSKSLVSWIVRDPIL